MFRLYAVKQRNGAGGIRTPRKSYVGVASAGDDTAIDAHGVADDGLRELARVWPTLSKAARAALVQLVRSMREGGER